MAFPNSAPNLTAQKIRKPGTALHQRQYQIDPYWGVPPGQPPMSLDATTGLIRPFSSYNTLATAVAAFVGFCDDTFPPGEDHSVWLITEAWIEMKLLTPLEVIAGDRFKPVLISGSPNYVSNDTVEAASGPGDQLAIFTAYEGCLCNPSFEPVSCPGDVPVAADVSPTSPIGRQTQRTVKLFYDGQ